jgi:hypothetical protein
MIGQHYTVRPTLPHEKIQQNTGCSLLPHAVDASNTVVISSVIDRHLQPVITQLSDGSLLTMSNKMSAVVKDMSVAQQWTQSCQRCSRTSPYSAWRLRFVICLEILNRTRKSQSGERSVTQVRSEPQTSRPWISKKNYALDLSSSSSGSRCLLASGSSGLVRKT